MYRTTFNIFADHDFDGYAQTSLVALKEALWREPNNYLLNVNEAEYIDHLVSTYWISPLVIDFDHVEASIREEMISAEHSPWGYHVREGQSYPTSVITYHIPVSGNEDLLNCIPNPRILMSYKVWLEEGAICFDIVDVNSNADEIKRRADSMISTIRDQSGHLSGNVATFNNSLREHAQALFETRKSELLKQSNTLVALGVPIRKAVNVPATFAVPAQRKQILPRPVASLEPARQPSPTLDEGIYQEILKTINDTGKVFERLPKTYADKDEEALRDHLILQLEPRFEYSTTGETFNKNGKTDILVRHEKSNLFVAECKFWGGAKKHSETIDQILSYLTWRDSKTAIVYFMDTKERSAPLKAIEESSPGHPCFLKLNKRPDQSWFDYGFNIPGDAGVEVRLTVLCFHLPK